MTIRLETVGAKAHNLTARSGDRTVAAPSSTCLVTEKKGEG
jgi:hypothetical protein